MRSRAMKAFAVLCLFTSCTVLQNNGFVSRSAALMKEHCHVYRLPFETGKRFRMVQGYESLFSHFGDYAVDFAMPIGTAVVAARGGVVVFVRESDTAGGASRKYVGTGNGIMVKHSDATYAHYWHLRHNGASVALGDTVREGQEIGRSGNTGFTAFPHLHFEVTRTPKKSESDFPVLFLTEKGPKFLQPLRRYRAI